MAQSQYKERAKINFALLYFNIAQVYLLLDKYEISMENLEMACQYQKVSVLKFIIIGYFE